MTMMMALMMNTMVRTWKESVKMDIKEAKDNYVRRIDTIINPTKGLIRNYTDVILTDVEEGRYMLAQEACFEMIRLLGEVNEKKRALKIMEDSEK